MILNSSFYLLLHVCHSHNVIRIVWKHVNLSSPTQINHYSESTKHRSPIGPMSRARLGSRMFIWLYFLVDSVLHGTQTHSNNCHSYETQTHLEYLSSYGTQIHLGVHLSSMDPSLVGNKTHCEARVIGDTSQLLYISTSTGMYTLK